MQLQRPLRRHATFRKTAAQLTAALALGAATMTCAQSPEAAPPVPSDTVLRQRYALPGSHFAKIAGEDIHYVDEGKGPAILLLHGSFANVRQLDGWAKVLSRKYRVVRFDQSPGGLSGGNPRGDYSITQRIAVIDGLMDKLGIDKFVLLGTSSSGVPATAYAAARPARLNGLILANIAVADFALDFASMPKALQDVAAEDRTHPTFHRPEFWRQILLANITDDSHVTPELVEQWTVLNNRALRDPEAVRAIRETKFSFASSGEDLKHITTPTLFVWGRDEHETPLETHGIPGFAMSVAKDKTLELIPACSHMMPLDCPVQSAERMLPFLERVTGR
jgi:pimeloyl-ACP methyl ester carboxylesterase